MSDHIVTRDQIIAANPLDTVVSGYGIDLKRIGGELYGVCPFHGDSKPSLRLNLDRACWYCDPCGFGGSVIDFVMKKEGLDVGRAMEKLGGKRYPAGAASYEQTVYPYTDENGNELFQVVRLYPKSFRQRRKGPDGKWIWKLDGVRRVPYRLHKLVKSQEVVIVEGEKDVETAESLGLVATCNPMGAEKWMDSFNEFFVGKQVVVIPDNDEKGRIHADKIIASLKEKAKWIVEVKLPDQYKDLTDFVVALGKDAKAQLWKLIEGANKIQLEQNIPIKSMAELESDYAEFTKKVEQRTLNLGRWIPEIGGSVRPLVPGELVAIIAATGVGKTAILQNIAMSAMVKTLIFELELPGTLMFERFLQMEKSKTGTEIFSEYRRGQKVDWTHSGTLDHIYVCDKSKMDITEMERIINCAELRMGERPALVCVDYVGLMKSSGKSRYEKVSEVAEQLKVIAKSTNTVVIMASQVSRKEDDENEVFLCDAKDSGSIENSAGLVLGFWREGDNGEILKCKILKNTKGRAGRIFDLDFHGEHLRITRKSLAEQYQSFPP